MFAQYCNHCWNNIKNGNDKLKHITNFTCTVGKSTTRFGSRDDGSYDMYGDLMGPIFKVPMKMGPWDLFPKRP